MKKCENCKHKNKCNMLQYLRNPLSLFNYTCCDMWEYDLEELKNKNLLCLDEWENSLKTKEITKEKYLGRHEYDLTIHVYEAEKENKKQKFYIEWI